MSALAMATVASAGVDTFCSNPNFCVFEREAPELLFCLDKQEVGSGPSRCVLTSPLIPLPLLRSHPGMLTSSKVSPALCCAAISSHSAGNQLWLCSWSKG